MTFFFKDMKHLNVASESYVPATLNIIYFLHSTCKMSSLDTVIKSRQKVNEINGIQTQVVCTEFSNYIFVVLTQYGKIGSLISITPDSRSTDISTPTFSTKVLLGKDEVRLGWMREVINMGLVAVTQDLFKASKLTSSPADICFMLVLGVLIVHLKSVSVRM